MNPDLQSLLARLPFPGVVACGGCQCKGGPFQQSYADWLSAPQLTRALNQVAQATANLKRQGLEPTRLTWSFEHLRLDIAVRADGSWLALFLQNRADLPVAAVADLLEQFNAAT